MPYIKYDHEGHCLTVFDTPDACWMGGSKASPLEGQ